MANLCGKSQMLFQNGHGHERVSETITGSMSTVTDEERV